MIKNIILILGLLLAGSVVWGTDDFGATLDGGGCFFKVWAPNAQQVYVKGDFNGNSDTANQLTRSPEGYWYGYVNGAVKDQKYVYHIQGPASNPVWFDKPDPCSRMMEHSAGKSIIKDMNAFAWTDGGWVTPDFENMVIYEAHVGTFTWNVDGKGGTFNKLVAKLDYIKGLGCNAIELLPVNEVFGDFYLGYAQVTSYAIESSYGSATGKAYDELKALVNAAHGKGIAVIQDVCFNHYSSTSGSDNFLWAYDGYYNNGDQMFYSKTSTQWGTAPNWWNADVRRYMENANRMFLGELHIDGVRWDHTQTIIDYGAGEYMRAMIWNLQQTSGWAKKIFIAEENPYNQSIVSYYNFDAGWHVDFHHGIEQVFGGEQRGIDVYQAINGGGYGAVYNRVVYSLGHDECRNGGKYNAERFGGRDSWDCRAICRAFGALQFFVPGIPMLWQGEEFLQTGDFSQEDANHSPNWSFQTDGVGSQMQKMYQDAVYVRKAYTSLRYGALNWAHNITGDKVIAFTRYDSVNGERTLVVANFSPTTWGNHGFFLYTGNVWGQWTQVFCSQDSPYGGWDGAGNAYYEPWTTGSGGIWINVPKYSVMVFKLK